MATKTPPKTYRAVVIGCGRIGCGFDDDPQRPNKIMTHAGAYARHERTKLVALVDVDREKLKKYGTQYGVNTYTDARTAFQQEKPDIVSICTLMDSHLALVKEAIAAGVKMIWCEKPLAPTLADCKEIEQLCAKNKIFLINNLIKRFQPEFQQIRTMVQGIRPQRVTIWYTGGFLNNGIHQVDLLRFMLGEITSVSAAISKAPPRTPEDPNYDGTLTLANGLTATITAADETNAAVTSKGGTLRVLIEGANGTLDLDHWDASLTQNGVKKMLSVKGQQDYMRNAVTNLVDAFERDVPLLCTAQDGTKAMELCLAFRDAVASGKTIAFGNQPVRAPVLMDKPALLGGRPLLEKPLAPTNTMGDEEVAAATRAIKTGQLSGFIGVAGPAHLGGPEVLALEQWFKNKFGVKYAIGLNSATTALQAMLAGVDIGAGDEVIVPPYTMCATATAVLCNNAIPIFADIDARTFNMDPKDVERKITPRTKAILTVNLFGQASDLDALKAIADKHGIVLLEDNAQSPGAKYKGKWTGTIGAASVFSLNQNKTVHCGEGGVVLTNDARIAHRVQLVRNHGEVIMDHLTLANPNERYEPLLGNNFRFVEPLAAIAHEQMKKLDTLTAPRIELAQYLTEKLKQFDCLTPPHIPEGNTHVYFLYAMKFDAKKAGMSRTAFVKALQAENLPVGPGYIRPIYFYPLYQQPGNKCAGPFAYEKPNYPPGLCPVTEKLWFEELVTTNICRYPHTKEHVDLFVKGIAKVLAAKDELAVLKL